jgi:hypothetical protein
VASFYNIGDRKTNIIHTKLRHRCSGLNADLYRVKGGWGGGVKLINCVEIISRLGIIIIKSTSLSNKFLH